FGIPHSTLCDQIQGIPTCKQAHEHEHLLMSNQEDVLVEWIKGMGRRGLPVTQEMLSQHAGNI
ncbi:hypothetical protein P691DRAFT_610598, partial [Macrolepiota fuliginosa MF-IS2]